ncbi:MAG: PTS sugar transporter subunit IIA [Eubacteriales bacterium]
MIGIVIVTHGKFGKAMIESAELIIGRQKNIIGLGLEHDDSVELLQEEIKKCIDQVDTGKGVLVFTDVFGGSPANITLKCMKERNNFRGITGVNMPMLLEALSQRGSLELEELTKRCIKTGTTGVIDLYKQFIVIA